MKTLAYIAIFAIAGALARYGQMLLVGGIAGHAFPWSILSINVFGSFVMGFLFFETIERIAIDPELRTGLLTGFLGAYTTFSTFTLGTLKLIEIGAIGRGLLYSLGSIVLGLFAVMAGAHLSRRRSGG